jgi:hypothetical protein
MEAGICMHAEDYYDLCGDCETCLEEKCCPELIACRSTEGCLACVANDPQAVGPCEAIPERNYLLQCTLKCERCHAGFDAAPLDCNSPPPHAGGGGSGGSAGGAP